MSESVKLGKVAMTLGGDYNSSQSYDKLTCVQYDGCSWVSKKQVPEGVAPTPANSAYWQKISDRGLQGATGAPGQSYVDKELVPIVNDLTTGGSANVLSAEQGKVLDEKIAKLSAEVGNVADGILYINAVAGLHADTDVSKAFKSIWVPKRADGVPSKLYIKRVRNMAGRADSMVRLGTTEADDTSNIVAQFYQDGLSSGIQEITIAGFSSYENKVTIKCVIDWDAISGQTFPSCGYIELDESNISQEDALSLKDKVKELSDNQQEGVVWNPTYIGYYVNMSSKAVGDKLSIAIGDALANATRAAVFVPVKKGDVLEIVAKGGSGANNLYAILDKNNIILAISYANINSRNNPLMLQVEQDDAYLLMLNFTDYDDTIDYVKKIGAKTQADWEGLNVACFGDSITEFRGLANLRYSEWLASLSKAKVYNLGWGGSRLSSRTETVTTPTSTTQAQAAFDVNEWVKACMSGDFSKQIAAQSYNYSSNRVMQQLMQTAQGIDWNKIDVITIFAGTNDWTAVAAMGEDNSEDRLTIKGAINCIVRDILSAYPHIRIYWFSPIVRYASGSLNDRTPQNWGDNVINGGRTLKELSAEIMSAVAAKKIPVCDTYNTLGWNEYNFAEFFRDTDNTHPYKGFEPIAKKMIAFINANRTF